MIGIVLTEDEETNLGVAIQSSSLTLHLAFVVLQQPRQHQNISDRRRAAFNAVPP